ncbi:MAG TPA: DUF429 domain-containing protein [Thermoplasmata archaeon]|nr:DUF429 domain-containing protein [Thermoplasmata archaeon]
MLGIDLAGSPHRATGACLLARGKFTRCWVLGDDAEILDLVDHLSPALIVVDAPLSLPRGRESLERAGPPHLRACDKELQRLGIRFFPVTLGPMRLLTARGLRLKAVLDARGIPAFEGYPGGTQDLLGWPRKTTGVVHLERALRRAGFTGAVVDRHLTHDELDAVTIAWTGRLFLRGRARLIGDPSEGVMLLPDIDLRPTIPCRAGSVYRGKATLASNTRGS